MMSDFPKAIFFDFDGVILESADIKTDAFLELFNDHPQHLDAIKNYHLRHMGVSRFKKFEWIYKELFHQPLDEETNKNLGDRFSDIVLKKILAAPYVPGAIELLENVYRRSSCFIASGTPQNELEVIVMERNIAHYFAEVFGSPATKTEIVETVLEKCNLERSNCWFVGDAISDYDSARATGLTFVARNTASMSAYWHTQSNVRVVESLDEMLKFWP